MFKCDKCGRNTKYREKQNKVIAEKRVKNYGFIDGKERIGWEVVKEINVCDKCFKDGE